MKLYQIANEYQAAFDVLSEIELVNAEFEEVPTLSQLIDDSLAGIKSTFEEKAKALVAHIKNLDAEIREISYAVDILQAREGKISTRIDSLKDYLLKNMKACDLTKIADAINPVSIRKNPPKLIIDESKLDNSYITIQMVEERIICKDVIKQKLKDGEKVDGAHLEQTERLHFD